MDYFLRSEEKQKKFFGYYFRMSMEYFEELYETVEYSTKKGHKYGDMSQRKGRMHIR